MRIKDEAEYIITRLLCHGCIIHRRNSYQSGFIHLKVDGGISIHIANQQGEGNLQCSFNLNVDSPGRGIRRHAKGHLYSVGSTDDLVNAVLERRNKLMHRSYDYPADVEAYIQLCMERGDRFWKSAYCVNKKRPMLAGTRHES